MTMRHLRLGGEESQGGGRSRPVSRVLSGACAPWQPFLWDRGYPRTQATYPEAARTTPWLPYLVLHRMGFTSPERCRRGSGLLPGDGFHPPPQPFRAAHYFTLA